MHAPILRHVRSKASYDGHPIHPALIPFPFAFLIGAFGFDALAWAFSRGSLWRTGGYLAIVGVGSALIAAVPGFIDYLYTVPPRSSGKQRATRHMLLNLTVVVLFLAALAARRNTPPTPLVVGIELVAVLLLLWAGWLGGVLVSRNQIGVDHRYADAGKWKEASFDASSGGALVIGNADDLAVNQMKLLRIGERRLVLARDEKGYAAFDDRCTHKGASLADGSMICGTVQCPWHGSQFDVRSGEVKAGPATSPIASHRVEQRDGKLFLST
jgi:nitrite reductase/ring-hydroxylating ferredoxin subunit/uncharacterized membrane protein